MFAVLEDYKSIQDEDDKASTCLAHTERKDAAQQELNLAKQLDFELAIEIYNYRLIEFNGVCPNCGRNFGF